MTSGRLFPKTPRYIRNNVRRSKQRISTIFHQQKSKPYSRHLDSKRRKRRQLGPDPLVITWSAFNDPWPPKVTVIQSNPRTNNSGSSKKVWDGPDSEEIYNIKLAQEINKMLVIATLAILHVISCRSGVSLTEVYANFLHVGPKKKIRKWIKERRFWTDHLLTDFDLIHYTFAVKAFQIILKY